MQTAETLDIRITEAQSGLIYKLYQITETLFMIELAVGVAHLFQGSTSFYLGNRESAEYTFIAIMAGTVLAKTVFFLLRGRARGQFGTDMKIVGIAALIAAVYLIVYHTLQTADERSIGSLYLFLVFIGLSVIGTVGIDYNRLLRLHAIVITFFFIMSVAASLCGASVNYVHTKDWHIRSSWGICYPTDFAAYCFYICVYLWMAFKRIEDLWFLLPGGLGLLLAGYVAWGVTGMICISLFLVVIILNYLFKKGKLDVVKKICETAACWAFPAFTVLMNGLMLAYNKGLSFAYSINEIISGRLALGAATLNTYGITLFGSPLPQHGFGGTAFSDQAYDFVDVSYQLILLRYGIITLIMINILWVLMTQKALKIGDRRLVFGMALIAVHSMIEHHFTDANYNILVLMPLSVLMADSMGDPAIKTKEATTIIPTKQRIMYTAAILAVITAAVVVPFRLLPWVRTIVQCIFVENSVENSRFLNKLFILGSAAVVAVCYCIFKFIYNLIHNNKSARIYGATCLIALIGALAFLYLCNSYLGRLNSKKGELIEADREAIQVIQSVDGGRLYSHVYPELYKRTYSGISTSLFDKEELAHFNNVSEIVDADEDLPIMFDFGFLYTRISDKHALYTNDTDVIGAMKSAGYHFTGYNSNLAKVDMAWEASLNQLELEKDGSFILSGGDKYLESGPAVNLLGGAYNFCYDLSIEEGSADEKNTDDKIGQIKITSQYGENILKTATLRRADFDEEGNYKAQIRLGIQNSAGVEMKLKPVSGVKLRVNEMTYQKVPDYDTHFIADNKHRHIREDYYDLDGNVLTIPAGYTARDIDYDKKDNRNHEVYYDDNGDKVINESGFCEIRREYDDNNRVTREEYYGPDGNLCLRKEGFAVTTIEYDGSGKPVTQKYFDTAGALMLNSSGYAIIHREYDETGRLISENYYGTDEKPIKLEAGQSGVRYSYYKDTWTQSEVRYCDEEGKPVMIQDGYSVIKRDFDKDDRMIKETYCDASEKVINRADGFAYTKYEYDENGSQTYVRYYDINDRPVNVSGTYSMIVCSYDGSNRLIREEYCNTGNELANNKDGYAYSVIGYDKNGLKSSQTYYDTNNTEVSVEQ